MDIIEVESIQDVTVEVKDKHTRTSDDVTSLVHNLETVRTNEDSIIIRHKDEEIAKIISENS